MSRAGDLVPLIRPPSRPGPQLQTAGVVSWDAGSGYAILVNGAPVAVTSVLAGVTVAAGDTVLTWRTGTSILVLGVITDPA